MYCTKSVFKQPRRCVLSTHPSGTPVSLTTKTQTQKIEILKKKVRLT